MEPPTEFPLQDILEHIRARGAELGLRADSDEQLLEAVLEHDVRVPEADEQAFLHPGRQRRVRSEQHGKHTGRDQREQETRAEDFRRVSLRCLAAVFGVPEPTEQRRRIP